MFPQAQHPPFLPPPYKFPVPERKKKLENLSRASSQAKSEIDLVSSDGSMSDSDVESEDSGSSSDASDSWMTMTRGPRLHTLESFPGSPSGEFWVQIKQKNLNKTTFKACITVPLVIGTLDLDSTVLVLDHQGWEVACIPTRLMPDKKASGKIALSERVQVSWRCVAGISNLTYPQLISKVAKKTFIFVVIFCTLALLCMLEEAQQTLGEVVSVVNKPTTLGVVFLRMVVSALSFLNSLNILRGVLPENLLTTSNCLYAIMVTLGLGLLSSPLFSRFIQRLQKSRVHELTFSILATETKHHSLKAIGSSRQHKRMSRKMDEHVASSSPSNFSPSPLGRMSSSGDLSDNNAAKLGQRLQPWGRWAEADPGLIRVKKNETKVPAGPYMYGLKDVFLFHLEYKLFNVATRLKSPVMALSASPRHPFLIVNFQFLGPKWLARSSAGDVRDATKSERYYNLVAYFQHQTDAPENPVNRLLQRFVQGSDEFRNQRVKVVPRFPYDRTSLVRTVIQKAVMSRTLPQTFFTDRSRSYVEVDIDVSGSKIARKLTRLVSGHSTSLVLDLSLVFESHKFEPTCFLGGVRLIKPDLTKVPHIRRFQPMFTEPGDSGELDILHLHQQDRTQVHHQPWGLWSEASPACSLSQVFKNPVARSRKDSGFLYRLAMVEVGSTEYKLFHASSRLVVLRCMTFLLFGFNF